MLSWFCPNLWNSALSLPSISLTSLSFRCCRGTISSECWLRELQITSLPPAAPECLELPKEHVPASASLTTHCHTGRADARGSVIDIVVSRQHLNGNPPDSSWWVTPYPSVHGNLFILVWCCASCSDVYFEKKKKEWLGNFVVHVNVTECIQDLNNMYAMYAVVQLASNSPHSSCLGLMSARDAGVRHAPPRPALIFLSRSVLR